MVASEERAEKRGRNTRIFIILLLLLDIVKTICIIYTTQYIRYKYKLIEKYTKYKVLNTYINKYVEKRLKITANLVFKLINSQI